MGGASQSINSSDSVDVCSQVSSVSPNNPVRSHENISKGEVHFHDDVSGLKCAISSSSFFNKYHQWRSLMDGNLYICGNDGHGGHSFVRFTPYIDNQGNLQISQSVQKVSIGQTIKHMDTLAHWS